MLEELFMSIKDNCTSACMVLCNHLDGAIYDLEQGNIDNYNFIYECIMGLKELGDYSYHDYLERFNAYIEKNNINFYGEGE